MILLVNIAVEQFQQIQVLQSGFGAIIIGGLILSAAVAAVTLAVSQKGQSDQTTQPNVSVTTADEGGIIFWSCGTGKHVGNIVNYSPVVTKPIKQKGGGKGMGGGSAATGGFHVFMDLMKVLGRVAPTPDLGRAVLHETYINDTPKATSAAATVFNDGTNSASPSFLDEGPKHGIVHISYQRLNLGDNASAVPNIKYVYSKISTNPIPSNNIVVGDYTTTNPAAECYDAFLEVGTSTNLLDLPSFNTAATFWGAKGWGVSFRLSSSMQLREYLDKVLQHVDGMIFRNLQGKFSIRALDKNDASVITIPHKHMKGLSFTRKDFSEVPNSFTVTFTDKDQAFTRRTVSYSNLAAQLEAGREIPAPIDLEGFIDINVAAARGAEIAKRESYPRAIYTFTTFLKYSIIQPGDVFTIQIERNYGEVVTVDRKLRCQKITRPARGEVEIKITAIELVEALHDDVFVVEGGSDAEDIDLTPIELVNVRFFELPFNPITQFTQAFIVLATREKGFETSFDLHTSLQSDANFKGLSNITTFAQSGNLSQAYTSDTFRIDDEIGIIFTPRNSFDTFNTISRDQLFSQDRAVIIGDEMIGFERVETLENGDLHLLGLIRGMYNTPIQTHADEALLYLVDLNDNIVDEVLQQSFYAKVVPRFLGNVADISTIPATQVTGVSKALKPRAVARIVAVRVGTTVTVVITPNTPGIPGAGDRFASIPNAERPYPYSGQLLATYLSTTDEVVTQDELIITTASAFNLTIKHKLNGFTSSNKTLSIGAVDGEYII